jgi:predicted Ser/Thr protein kinase
MSGFLQALRAYREGALSREKLLSEVERLFAEREIDAVSLLKLLNEEHERAHLPDNLHGAIAARILHWRDPPPRFKPLTPKIPFGGHAPRLADDLSAAARTRAIDNEATVIIGSGSLPSDPDSRRGAPIAVGTVLQGRFKLVESVRQDGMSAVYKAIDLRKVQARSADPYVAVKLLTIPSSGFGHSLALLQSEAQKLQSLPHPNIVRVIDCDRDGRTVFMTMEYLTGEPLKRRLVAPDYQGMPVAEAERIVESIAAALDFAHRNGVIHGDLKPGNIIITDKGEVKVIDFGLARLMTRPQPALAALTPLYASPEMLEQRSPDTRDDIYALACIAHEILTGLHPFDERSALDARDAELILERHKGMTRCQYRAIAHGLEFDRERRTPSARQFLEEFRGRRSRPLERTLLLAGAVGLILVATLYLALRG